MDFCNNLQSMQCVLCHPIPLEYDLNFSTQGKNNGFVNYKEHNTSVLKKHVTHEQSKQYRKQSLFLVEKVSKTKSDKQFAKKRKIVPPFKITKFFNNQCPYNKSNPTQQSFMEVLVFHVVKGYKILTFVENLWLKQLVLR